MVASATLAPSEEVLLLVVRFNGWSDLCSNPDPEQLIYKLPAEARPQGWTKVSLERGLGWLDSLPADASMARFTHDQAGQVRAILDRWERFHPSAPAVSRLRAALAEHERRTQGMTP